jgi:hypothetical protein
MFQVAFGDPDKSDSYRKKKEVRQRIRSTDVTDVTDVRKKEEGRSNRPHPESATPEHSHPQGGCYFNKKLCLEKINIS